MENNDSAVPSQFFMARCFELAQRAKGHTAPNPMVGALLVHNDRVIGLGWHHNYGGDHAEVNCLKSVAADDKHLIPESTMYVNLEPCAHQGLTPPCADRLVHEKVKKVVIANTDPFEQVNGRGMSILKEGGVAVDTGVMEEDGLWVNRRFFCFHKQVRPYIILKWAQSKDGFIAPTDRSKLQISNTESQQLVHKWRTEETAIMVGTNTALNDDPQLTARLHEGKQPLRIVLDRKLQVPHMHHVYDSKAATWIINEQKEILYGNVHSVQMPFNDALLPTLMRKLHDTKVLSLIVEGGATLLNSFIALGLWDEARIFTGDIAMGDGIPAPAMKNAMHAFTKDIGTDELQVLINKDSAYAYVPGMEL